GGEGKLATTEELQVKHGLLHADFDGRERDQADDADRQQGVDNRQAQQRESDHRQAEQEAAQADGEGDASRPVEGLAGLGGGARPRVEGGGAGKSKDWRVLAAAIGSRRRQMPQIVPKTPSGTLARNTQRQEMAVSNPPRTGPSRNPAAPAIWFTPRPSPIRPW